MYFAKLLAAMFIYLSYALYQDQKIRDAEYTKPLSTMPDNARALYEQMLSAETSGKALSDEAVAKIRLEILATLSKGAVAQRNHEMSAVRQKISSFGYVLSWFLKQKGLSYQQIFAKYRLDFSEGDQQLHLKIIESASRANPSVFWKLVGKLQNSVTGGPPAKL